MLLIAPSLAVEKRKRSKCVRDGIGTTNYDKYNANCCLGPNLTSLYSEISSTLNSIRVGGRRSAIVTNIADNPEVFREERQVEATRAANDVDETTEGEKISRLGEYWILCRAYQEVRDKLALDTVRNTSYVVHRWISSLVHLERKLSKAASILG
jgi:hypothetical protein